MSEDDIVPLFDSLAWVRARVAHAKCRRCIPVEDLHQEALLAALLASRSYSSLRNCSMRTWVSNKMGFAVVDLVRRELKTRRRFNPRLRFLQSGEIRRTRPTPSELSYASRI